MNKTTLTTLLSVVLFGSFFMPFFYWDSLEMNGFNFILSDRVPFYKYLLLSIPFTVLFYLFGVLSSENYPFSRKLLSWIPLTTFSAIFIVVFIDANSDSRFFENGNIFSNIGVGFWLALGLSLVLAFAKPKVKGQYQY
jgi:hypothetical protein